ncbi:MAG: hypothetical protein KYX62_06550 [Pseudomonadota bacterium]|nr:hypothetical protein [Pseudomonadota bacterium]
MADLLQDLEATIARLETIRDNHPGVDGQLLDQIDALYDQQLRLIEASVSAATAGYREATTAMNKASAKAKQAIADIEKVDDLIDQLASAIELVEGLIS